jgi:predicted CXXCH cytochrome family protein
VTARWIGVAVLVALFTGTAAAAPPPAFVGAPGCAECHAQTHAAWSGSHHALAMQVANDTTVLGRFDGASLTTFGVTSTFTKKDGKHWIRTAGPDGKLADYEVLYTFGVAPLQQYLVAFPNGRYQAPPVAWDTRPKAEGGQRWFSLQPDEKIPPGDLLHWTGVMGNWNQMCAACHSTDLRKNYDAQADRYATAWSEVNVACEACHGPGSNHVAWAKAGAGRGPDSDPKRGLTVDLGRHDPARWVMNPETGIAKRNPPLASHVEVETCAPCHARRGVVAEDYELGKPLLDTHRPALLDAPLYHADGQIQDEVYEYGSFSQSRMYAAGVTCSDCHDSHSGKLRNVTDDPNAVCSTCHLPAKFATPAHHHHAENSKGASCIACHMPAKLYMVIDERRDHAIRAPRPDLTLKIGTPNACNGCHTKESPQWAADATAKWYGPARANTKHYGEAIEAGRRNLPGAERALTQLAADATQPAIARATALAMLRGYLSPDSGPVIQNALADPDPLLRDAAVGALVDVDPRMRVPLTSPLLVDPVRTVRIDAARGLASVPAAQVPEALQPMVATGLAEYRAAQQLNSDRPEGLMNLAVLAAEGGDAAEAERLYRAALRLTPGVPAIYVNLADLYRTQGRDADGERELRKGLEVAPQSADLHHALGLLLVRAKRLPEALPAFARATQIDPDASRYAYVYAIAMNSSGQGPQAIVELERAYALHPGDVEIVSALAMLSQEHGDRDAARGWAQKLVDLAPQDARARALLESLSGAPRPSPPSP